MLEIKGFIKAQPDEIKGTRSYIVGAFMEKAGYPELQNEQVEIAVLELPLQDSAKPHYHKEMTEITIVLSGKLYLIVDGESVEAKEGEFFVVKPGTILQNPQNEPGTKVLVIKSPSLPDDKYYVVD
jgi:quercetin dioxygenase-like cupin family protein